MGEQPRLLKKCFVIPPSVFGDAEPGHRNRMLPENGDARLGNHVRAKMMLLELLHRPGTDLLASFADHAGREAIAGMLPEMVEEAVPLLLGQFMAMHLSFYSKFFRKAAEDDFRL